MCAQNDPKHALSTQTSQGQTSDTTVRTRPATTLKSVMLLFLSYGRETVGPTTVWLYTDVVSIHI